MDATVCSTTGCGPSTEYFGRLARQHHLYLVAGLVERAGHLVYNLAVLIGPDGKVVGKYRPAPAGPGGREAGLVTPVGLHGQSSGKGLPGGCLTGSVGRA